MKLHTVSLIIFAFGIIAISCEKLEFEKGTEFKNNSEAVLTTSVSMQGNVSPEIDKFGNFWINDYHSVYQFRNGKLYNYTNLFNNLYISDFDYDASGIMYSIGYEGERGLLKFDGESVEIYKWNKSEIDYVQELAVDKNDRVWLLSLFGPMSFNGSGWDYSYLDFSNSDPNASTYGNNYHSLHIDNQENKIYYVKEETAEGTSIYYNLLYTIEGDQLSVDTIPEFSGDTKFLNGSVYGFTIEFGNTLSSRYVFKSLIEGDWKEVISFRTDSLAKDSVAINGIRDWVITKNGNVYFFPNTVALPGLDNYKKNPIIKYTSEGDFEIMDLGIGDFDYVRLFMDTNDNLVVYVGNSDEEDIENSNLPYEICFYVQNGSDMITYRYSNIFDPYNYY